MYIILNTDEPEKIKVKKDKSMNFLDAENLKESEKYFELLNDIKNMSDFEYHSKYKIGKNSKSLEEFKNYLKNIILEPNVLSNEEIIDLGEECLTWANLKYDQFKKTDVGILHWATSFIGNDFKDIWEQLVSIINENTNNKSNIYPWNLRDFDFHPVKDLGILFPFRDVNSMYHSCTCGALNMRFYKLIYYFDFLGIKIKDPHLKAFWKFYKKTLNVYAISLQQYSWGCQIYIIPKFDEIHITNNVAHYKYNDVCYCDGIEVPRWLYEIDPKDISPDFLTRIDNVDCRSIMIKKAGLEKFLNMGEIIDTYENYPDNEWWAKSEYKLINMKNLIAKRIQKHPDGKIMHIDYCDYAPYLCMKNQTTGEYHLEGVSPVCRNLYDALKMRYKGLDLPSYEIKNIK